LCLKELDLNNKDKLEVVRSIVDNRANNDIAALIKRDNKIVRECKREDLEAFLINPTEVGRIINVSLDTL
jgi:hypothetical protein